MKAYYPLLEIELKNTHSYGHYVLSRAESVRLAPEFNWGLWNNLWPLGGTDAARLCLCWKEDCWLPRQRWQSSHAPGLLSCLLSEAVVLPSPEPLSWLWISQRTCLTTNVVRPLCAAPCRYGCFPSFSKYLCECFIFAAAVFICPRIGLCRLSPGNVKYPS